MVAACASLHPVDLSPLHPTFVRLDIQLDGTAAICEPTEAFGDDSIAGTGRGEQSLIQSLGVFSQGVRYDDWHHP